MSIAETSQKIKNWENILLNSIFPSRVLIPLLIYRELLFITENLARVGLLIRVRYNTKSRREGMNLIKRLEIQFSQALPRRE